MRYQKLQVCAWRVKYLILLEAPLEPYEWRALERLWEGSRLEIFVLGHETVLYKLTLPERKGMVTGSSISSELYAVFLRSEAEGLLRRLGRYLEGGLGVD